jgi:hypothetical protein
MSYISSLLVPNSLRKPGVLKGENLNQLMGRIQHAIEHRVELPQAFTHLEGKTSREEWHRLFREFQDKAVARGDWLADHRPEAFDWQAARERVEKVLNEYRESLASLAGGMSAITTSEALQRTKSAQQASKKRAYLNSWKNVLGAFLGWPEERVLQWVKQDYEYLLNMPDSFVYRTSAMFYIIPLLLSDRLRRLSTDGGEVELRPRIQTAIECRISPPIPEWLKALRTRVDVEEWLQEFQKYREEAVSRGEWFSEERADQYDWKAARDRVEEILNEYGESLRRVRE